MFYGRRDAITRGRSRSNAPMATRLCGPNSIPLSAPIDLASKLAGIMEILKTFPHHFLAPQKPLVCWAQIVFFFWFGFVSFRLVSNWLLSSSPLIHSNKKKKKKNHEFIQKSAADIVVCQRRAAPIKLYTTIQKSIGPKLQTTNTTTNCSSRVCCPHCSPLVLL